MEGKKWELWKWSYPCCNTPDFKDEKNALVSAPETHNMDRKRVRMCSMCCAHCTAIPSGANLGRNTNLSSSRSTVLHCLQYMVLGWKALTKWFLFELIITGKCVSRFSYEHMFSTLVFSRFYLTRTWIKSSEVKTPKTYSIVYISKCIRQVTRVFTNPTCIPPSVCKIKKVLPSLFVLG